MKLAAHWQFYQDHAGEWRWRFAAANGRTMADSGEGYTNRAGAVRAARRLATLIEEAVDPE